MTRAEKLRERVGSCLPIWTPEDQASRAVLAAIVDELGITEEIVRDLNNFIDINESWEPSDYEDAAMKGLRALHTLLTASSPEDGT